MDLIKVAKLVTYTWENQKDIPNPIKYLLSKGATKEEIKTVISILKEATNNTLKSIERNPEVFGLKRIDVDNFSNRTWGR